MQILWSSWWHIISQVSLETNQSMDSSLCTLQPSASQYFASHVIESLLEMLWVYLLKKTLGSMWILCKLNWGGELPRVLFGIICSPNRNRKRHCENIWRGKLHRYSRKWSSLTAWCLYTLDLLCLVMSTMATILWPDKPPRLPFKLHSHNIFAHD